MKIKLLLCLVLLPLTAKAATHVWSGAGINDLFTTAANWSSGGVPAVGEPGLILLQFPSVVGNHTPLDNISGLAVDGISFAGGNYNLRGSGGVTLTLRRAAVGAFSILCTASGGISNKIEASLPLVIASSTRVITDDHLNLDSTISGSGGLTCEGGDVHLRGTNQNSYALTTTVTAGTLHLEKANGFRSIGGELVIDGGTVRNEANFQIGATPSITFHNHGVYTLGPHSETLPALHFDTGTLQLPAVPGGLLTGNVTATSGGGFITGYLGLDLGVWSFDIAQGGAFHLSGKVANGFGPTSGISKLGGGDLFLEGANAFTGDVTVNDGGCYVSQTSSLGIGQGTTTVGDTGTLHFMSSSSMTFANQTLNLLGTVFVHSDVIWTGPIQITGVVSRFDGDAGALGPHSFTHSGVLSGSGRLTKQGASRLELQGAVGNSYTGGTQMDGGELFLGKATGLAIPGNLQIKSGTVSLTNSNQIATTAALSMNGGILDLGSRTNTIGLLSGSGGEIKFALGTLTVGTAVNSLWSGLLSGHGVNSLIKQGAGTLTLINEANGGDTLTGAIVVNQGVLKMNGLHPGPITVNIDGLLTGSGTVGAVTVQGGKVCLCNLSTGQLIINGGGSQAITGINFEGYDHIKVTGAVNLTGSTLNASLSYTPYVGSTFLLLDNDGTDPITGIFSGLPEGSQVIFGTRIFTLSYHGGTGNDVVLTLVSGGLPPIVITHFTVTPVSGNPNANTVLIEATGQPGVVHVIESSADLITWNVININFNITDAQGHSSTSFADDNPARRFYRVKEQSPI